MKGIFFLVLLFPTSALADGNLAARYGAITERCYEHARDHDKRMACIGRQAARCMAKEEDGETTLGMSMCTSAEADVWDRFLNAEYRETMIWVKGLDAAGAQVSPEFSNRAKALRAAQRAWIAFRDGQCRLEHALWGAGSMRQIAGAHCRLGMTARRAIALREMRDMMP